jgi:hypothetical protein
MLLNYGQFTDTNTTLFRSPPPSYKHFVNGLLSRAIFNPRRIKSIVMPTFASIESSSKRVHGDKDRFTQDGRRVIKAHTMFHYFKLDVYSTRLCLAFVNKM